MATIIPLWNTSGMTGGADKTSDVYIRHCRITGRSHAVRLRNPCTADRFNNAQITLNNRFGALNRGVAVWYRRITAPDASPEDKAVLEKLQRILRRQSKYCMVRGLVVAKYASVNDTLDTVTVTIDRYEATVHFAFNARPLA